MVDLVLSLALPLLVALAVSGIVRLSAGPERGARLLGAGLPAGFLAWWLWANGLGRAVEDGVAVAPVAALVGLVGGGLLNAVVPHRPTAWACAVLIAALAPWALAGGPLTGAGLSAAAGAMAIAVLPVAAALAGLGRARESGAPALLLLGITAAGLAGLAAALDRPVAAGAALALAVAVPGVLPWLPAAATPAGWIVTLSGGGVLAVLAGALLLATPAAALPLAVLALALLAEPTAERLPTGSGPLAAIARRGWLVVLAALPAGLAVLLAAAVARMGGG